MIPSPPCAPLLSGAFSQEKQEHSYDNMLLRNALAKEVVG